MRFVLSWIKHDSASCGCVVESRHKHTLPCIASPHCRLATTIGLRHKSTDLHSNFMLPLLLGRSALIVTEEKEARRVTRMVNRGCPGQVLQCLRQAAGRAFARNDCAHPLMST